MAPNRQWLWGSVWGFLSVCGILVLFSFPCCNFLHSPPAAGRIIQTVATAKLRSHATSLLSTSKTAFQSTESYAL